MDFNLYVCKHMILTQFLRLFPILKLHNFLIKFNTFLLKYTFLFNYSSTAIPFPSIVPAWTLIHAFILKFLYKDIMFNISLFTCGFFLPHSVKSHFSALQSTWGIWQTKLTQVHNYETNSIIL